ncbi:MAG: HEAT repeat domain-containing protein, partial [Chloroflexota bacterium]
MADMSPKYQKYVKGYTGYLKSKDVEKRRKGARMVGELGAAETIETLLDMAENDPDAEVRRNAKYSLGMFAAFRDAVESDDEDLQEEAIEALTRVMESGSIGKISQKKGGAPGWLVGVLGLLLVILIGGNVVIFLGLVPGASGSGDGTDDEPAFAINATSEEPESQLPEAPDQDVETLITQGREIITSLTDNVQPLRGRLEPISAGERPEQIVCQQFYDLEVPAPAISAGDAAQYPEILTVYEEIDGIRQGFDALNLTLESVCYDGVPLDTVDADAELAALDAFEAAAPQLSADLATARDLPTEVVPPTEPPAAVDAPPAENATEEPTVAPTEPPDTRRHVSAVVSILDEAGNDNPGSRSAYKLLEQYLIEARDTGATDGCRNPNISVPADYNLRASAPEQYDEIIALAGSSSGA